VDEDELEEDSMDEEDIVEMLKSGGVKIMANDRTHLKHGIPTPKRGGTSRILKIYVQLFRRLYSREKEWIPALSLWLHSISSSHPYFGE